jgi:hypothetical protein
MGHMRTGELGLDSRLVVGLVALVGNTLLQQLLGFGDGLGLGVLVLNLGHLVLALVGATKRSARDAK